MPEKSELEAVRVGGRIVSYRPKKATKTTAKKAEDKQADKTAASQKENS